MRATQALGGVDQHIAGRIEFLKTDNGRAATLDDTRLFRGNQFHPVAEKRLMIERDRHDHRNGGTINDIRRIEAPA